MLKAPPVAAKLEMQRQRGQRVDPAEASQSRDRRPPLLVGGELGEAQRDRGLA